MANTKSIGTAYTDQVIDGGTIDNTPIGSTTPTTGVFTTATAGVINVSAAVTVGQTAGIKLLNVSNATNLGSTSKIGQGTSDTVSFYGVTPVAQQSGATQAAVSTSALTAVSNSAAINVSLNDGYGFSQTQANQFITLAADTKTRLSATVTLVNQLRSDLQDLGLIAGS